MRTLINLRRFYGGGSYGGLGGINGSDFANAVYGDYHTPENLGSGSATGDGGAPGGGLVQIMAASAQVDGTILANGGNNNVGGGGGSGGGVLLNVGALSGAGTIAATAATAAVETAGAVGGGRVAIYYGANTLNLAINVTAIGGRTSAPGAAGAVGTVYLQQSGSPGQLVINNYAVTAGQWTPLGQTNDLVFAADNLVISGAGVMAATVTGAPIKAGSLSVVNGAVLTHLPTTTAQTYSLVVTVTNELLVASNSSINVSGRGYPVGYTLGDTTVGASSDYGGGSYGGLGGINGSDFANAVYGDYHTPENPGSGAPPATAGRREADWCRSRPPARKLMERFWPMAEITTAAEAGEARGACC